MNKKAVKLSVNGKIGGKIALPGSKSITNRVLLLAALANGKSILTGALKSDDTKYMAEALRQMGVTINEPNATTFEVISNGKLNAPSKELFLGNAGTAIRFLTAATATINGEIILNGDIHMQKRPIGPLVNALSKMGVEISATNNCPPVFIKGKGDIPSDYVEIDGSLSSQYVSALLMASAIGDRSREVKVLGGDIGARGYINITLACMKAFGAKFTEIGNLHWRVEGGGYKANDYYIEPDASAATYHWAINALLDADINIGMNASEMTQPDAKAFDTISQFPNLPAIIDGSQMQDAIPTIAVLAAFNNNPVRFIGIENLRVKECDRTMAVRTELNKIAEGIAHEEGDDLIINPRRDLIGQNIYAEIHTYSDHRIAMAFAEAALFINGIKILDPDCTAKTYPNYWEDLEKLGVGVEFID